MKYSDKTRLDMIKNSYQKTLKKPFFQKIFCDLYRGLIDPKRCEKCTEKCVRFYDFLEVYSKNK